MRLLDQVTRLLDDRQVSFALIGAAALAARGISRSTFDVDLLATDDRVLRDEFWDTLREGGVVADVRRGDSLDPLRGVIRIEVAGQRPVDVIVGRHAWQARAVERAERSSGSLPVVTACDLILLKLYAGGPQDLWDVRELLQLPDADALALDVTRDVADLSPAMRALWAEVCAH
jgi:hypothetical protein